MYPSLPKTKATLVLAQFLLGKWLPRTVVPKLFCLRNTARLF